MSGEVRPIRCEEDHAAALAEVERLWGSPAGTAEGNPVEKEPPELRLMVPAANRLVPAVTVIDPPDPIDAIQFRMDQQGLTRRDLEAIIGTRTRIAEVLNRKRGLSIAMIRRIHDRLGISADVLIRPVRKNEAA